MRIALALALAWLPAAAASAIELSLVGNGSDPELTLGLSETGTVSIHLVLGADEGDLASAELYFDQLGVDSFDVEDAIVQPPWRADRDGMDFPLDSLEDFLGRYGTDGLSGPFEGDIDRVILHGTAVGETDVYFEGPDTGGNRPPRMFDTENNQVPYSRNLDLPGFLHFQNAWRDDGIGFDRSFPVMVVPEPGAALLALFGAVGLIVRRRSA